MMVGIFCKTRAVVSEGGVDVMPSNAGLSEPAPVECWSRSHFDCERNWPGFSQRLQPAQGQGEAQGWLGLSHRHRRQVEHGETGGRVALSESIRNERLATFHLVILNVVRVVQPCFGFKCYQLGGT